MIHHKAGRLGALLNQCDFATLEKSMKKLVCFGEVVSVALFSALAAVTISTMGAQERETVAQAHPGLVAVHGHSLKSADTFKLLFQSF